MKCHWCEQECADGDVLLAHIISSHAPPAPIVPSPTSTSAVPAVPESNVPTAGYECDLCGKSYKLKRSLKRHKVEVHSNILHKCQRCAKTFKYLRYFKKHLQESKHGELPPAVGKTKVLKKLEPKVFNCKTCKAPFKSLIDLYAHKKSQHSQNFKYACNGCWKRFLTPSSRKRHEINCGDKKEKVKHARNVREMCAPKPPVVDEWKTSVEVEGDARLHDLIITDSNDLQLTLLENEEKMYAIVSNDLSILRRIKWYLSATIRCHNADGVENGLRYNRCSPIITLQEYEIKEQVQSAIMGVINSFDKMQAEGSQILFERVEKLELRSAKYSPVKGSSYMELPEKFQHPRRGLVNIKNEDQKCFLYSILAGINLPSTDPQRVSKYKGRMKELNMKGIEYPVKIRDISKFELQNPGISVSVFGLEDGEQVVPLRISKEIKEKHIHLLLLQSEEEEDESHYVLIKNLSSFLNHLSKRKRKLYYCENCLTPYASRDSYLEHRERCLEHDPQVVAMPKPRDVEMRFREWGNMARHDYCIYADFECVIRPLNTPHPDPSISSTTRTGSHIPCGFCYVIVKADGSLLKEPVLKYGENDLIKTFLLCLLDEVENIQKLRGDLYELCMSDEEQAEFECATKCYLCGGRLPRPGVKKVRDHDWSKPGPGHYRGAACASPCNLNLKRRTYIPVLMHNLKNYDAHLILSEIGQLTSGDDLSVVPLNKEKYVSFQWGSLRFLDSLGFLSSSLDKLVADLSDKDLILLKEIFPDPSDRALVSRKGCYPYSYFDSFEKFTETCLPPPEAFRNDLTGAAVSADDYQHAQNVFKHFKMKSLQCYHNLYLLTDTLLLSDCMENFRKIAMENYKLDPVHYYTTPGMAFSACLLFTKQRLELIDDIGIHLLFERGLRGGVASIQHRYVEANNKYIPESYSDTKPSSYLMYYDANSLYATALCSKLPTGGFRYLTASEISGFDPSNISSDADTGFIFVVDLEYSRELHDFHNDFPLAPEHMVPDYKKLSPLQKKMLKDLGLPKVSTKKLVPNLYDKKNYVVLDETLILYLELGLKLTKIHQIVEFQKSAWLKPFIEHNITMRKNSTSDFQKSFWKLMNNSVFGKTCEAVRKHRNVVLTKDRMKFRKLVRSPLFHSYSVFQHGLVCVERRKARVVLNRPVFVGMACLDISKKIMYNFYYNVLKSRYGDSIRMCGGDTDSLICEIFTDDVYADMGEMLEFFDTSDYPQDHPLYSLERKKAMGAFKDELNSVPIKAFIGLRAKMYSFQTNEKEKAVGKGVPRAALQTQITFQDYKDCITQFKDKNVSFSKISTDRKHNLFTTYCVKKALSCYDDKRFILENNFSTLAHGHYKISDCICSDDDDDDVADDDDEGARNLRELIMLQEEMCI